MRARMTLRYSNVVWRHREVDLKHKPQALLQASAKGTVPVLVLADGTVIDESLDIMRWALSEHDPAQWRAGYQRLPAALQQFVSELEARFKPALDSYKYNNRGTEQDWLPARTACLEQLQGLEALQAETRCLNAELPGFADVALMPFIRQYANVDPQWFASTDLPQLQGWLTTLLQAPAFTNIMTKHAPWQPTDRELIVGASANSS